MNLSLNFLETYGAAIAAVVSGIGVKLIDKLMSKRSESFGEASRIREELRIEITSLRSELEAHKQESDEWRQEADEWRDKYYEKVEENLKMVAEVESLRSEIQTLQHKVEQLSSQPSTSS